MTNSEETVRQEPARLSAPEIADGLRMTPEQLRILDAVAEGRDVNGKKPGVREVMAALSLKASMSVARPRERGDESQQGTTVFQFVDPYGDRPECATCPHYPRSPESA